MNRWVLMGIMIFAWNLFNHTNIIYVAFSVVGTVILWGADNEQTT